MEGLNVLSTELLTKPSPGWISALIAVGIILFVVAGLSGIAENYTTAIIFGVISIVLLILSITLEVNYEKNEDNKYIQYEVLMEEAIKVEDFFEKYEIVDTRGKILVVVDKECGEWMG